MSRRIEEGNTLWSWCRYVELIYHFKSEFSLYVLFYHVKSCAQIKSSYAKETAMTYRITGEGADQPPVGIFTIDKYTGWLFVTMLLDREKKDRYVVRLFQFGYVSSV